MDWDEFDKFEGIINKYMEPRGEGTTMASQIVTAVNKLVYKWYNDGDVYDNTHYLKGWWNDLSSYANWLYKHAGASELLEISTCKTDEDYERLLYKLAEGYLEPSYLEDMAGNEKIGTIYDCDGPFHFNDGLDDIDDEDEEDDEW